MSENVPPMAISWICRLSRRRCRPSAAWLVAIARLPTGEEFSARVVLVDMSSKLMASMFSVLMVVISRERLRDRMGNRRARCASVVRLMSKHPQNLSQEPLGMQKT